MGRLDELLLVHGSIRLHVFYWGVAVQDKSKRTKQVRDGRQRSRWYVRRMHRGYIGVLWSKRREDSPASSCFRCRCVMAHAGGETSTCARERMEVDVKQGSRPRVRRRCLFG